MDPLATSVATRYAREFTPKEWETHQQKHPKADKSRHEIRKPGESKGEGEPKEKAKGGFLSGLKGKLSKMSDAAKKVLTDAPKAVQQFATDSKFRKEALGTAKDAIKAAPGKYVKSLVSTAKHEIKEFKDASLGIGRVMTGKKATPEQKHAIKAVAKHMAIMVAAAAFSTATAGAGAAFVGGAMGKHLALKAAANVLGEMHTLGEVGIIGQGVVGLLSKLSAEDAKKLTPDEALAMLVTAQMTELMDNLTDDDMAAILEDAASTKKEASIFLRVVARHDRQAAPDIKVEDVAFASGQEPEELTLDEGFATLVRAAFTVSGRTLARAVGKQARVLESYLTKAKPQQLVRAIDGNREVLKVVGRQAKALVQSYITRDLGLTAPRLSVDFASQSDLPYKAKIDPSTQSVRIEMEFDVLSQ